MQQQPMQQMSSQQMQQMLAQQHMQQPHMQQMMPNQPQHMQQMMPNQPQHMQQQLMQQQLMQQQLMQQQPMQQQLMQQQPMQQQPMQQQLMQQQPMQQQLMQQQPMQPPNMQQMNPNMIPNQQQQQQNRNFTTKPNQVPMPAPSQSMNPPSNTTPVSIPSTNTTIAPNTLPTIPVQQEPDRSVIHIDSRERNILECSKSNPFSIYMNDGTTCIVCVRDLVTTNIHNDPYLLIQISEYSKSVYENQLNREVHFKLVRVHKDDNCAYYKNTDMETMIRLRDINKVTFNIIRPNGKLLYSYVNDIREASTIAEEQFAEFLDANQELRDRHVEVLTTIPDLIEVHDTVTVFERDIESGLEAKVIIVDKANNRVVLEHLDDSFTSGNNKRILLNKFQVSISLEII